MIQPAARPQVQSAVSETKEVKSEPVYDKDIWLQLGLSKEIESVLFEAGLTAPTPVQFKAIPAALEGKDLVVSAQTGTGKTLGFSLPVMELLAGKKGTRAVILAPSREIALQTHKVFSDLGPKLGIVSVCLIGGTNLKEEEKLLAEYPQVIVATPGRLCDHLERGNIWMEYIEMLVIDEADRMFEMGFSEQLNKIISSTSTDRQTLLFSATMPPKVEVLAEKVMYEPVRIQIGKVLSPAKTVDQKFIFVHDEDKLYELIRLLKREQGTVFVFVRSKHGAAKLWRDLRNRRFHEATQLHSDLKQNVREAALEEFKNGQYRVLIATDVVGRGIHVDNVSHVVNYDLPRDVSDYIHRIGRTGRAGEKGRSTSFVTSKDKLVLGQLEKLLDRKIQ